MKIKWIEITYGWKITSMSKKELRKLIRELFEHYNKEKRDI